MNWEEKKDDNGNTIYFARGPINGDGEWTVRPALRNDNIVWIVDPSGDLVRSWPYGNDKTFRYLNAALPVDTART